MPKYTVNVGENTLAPAREMARAASMLAEYAGRLCFEKYPARRSMLIMKVCYWIGEFKESRDKFLTDANG